MDFRRRFATRLIWHTAWLFGATVLTAVLAVWGHAPTAAFIAGLGVLLSLATLWDLIDQSNADLSRYVAALNRDDLTQSFLRSAHGSHFDQVGDAYDRALARLRDERAASVASSRFAETLADSAPIALLVLDGDQVTIANKAARRLFGRTGEVSLATLAVFNPDFGADLAEVMPGTSRLSRLTGQGIAQRVSLDATLMEVAGTLRRIVAIRIVQPELDRAELAAQVDLVRVLTHELMNSLTPVVSLAGTADRMIAMLTPALAPGIAEAQLAVGTLARRAVELERFVESYKGFSEAPTLKREAIDVGEWLDRVVQLFQAAPFATRVAVTLSIAVNTPAIDGDTALLTQVMLNLLKNAAEAIAGIEPATICVTAAGLSNGQVKLSVIDSGPGIPMALRNEIFLPFFTTKRSGTGIGLSFARQITLLHGGQIGVSSGKPNRIELVLPSFS